MTGTRTHPHVVKIIWRQHGRMHGLQHLVNTCGQAVLHTRTFAYKTLAEQHTLQVDRTSFASLPPNDTEGIDKNRGVWYYTAWTQHTVVRSKWSQTHPGVCNFELPQDVLGHVVLRHRVNHKVLVPGGALGGPVLVTLFLKEQKHNRTLINHETGVRVLEGVKYSLIFSSVLENVFNAWLFLFM